MHLHDLALHAVLAPPDVPIGRIRVGREARRVDGEPRLDGDERHRRPPDEGLQDWRRRRLAEHAEHRVEVRHDLDEVVALASPEVALDTLARALREEARRGGEELVGEGQARPSVPLVRRRHDAVEEVPQEEEGPFLLFSLRGRLGGAVAWVLDSDFLGHERVPIGSISSCRT